MSIKLSKFAKLIEEKTYLFIELNINKEKYYPYKELHPYGGSLWVFKDAWNLENAVRIIKGAVNYNVGEYYEINAGRFSDNTIVYDNPSLYDDKLFNTYIKIVCDEIINKKSDARMYRLAPIEDDSRRKRLFLIAINKYISGNDWKVFENKKDPVRNAIWIRRKVKNAPVIEEIS